MAERSRGASWSDEEVLALISIWGDARVQQELDGAVRNKAVFEKISRKMTEMGFVRDWKQCRAKLKNLKVGYKAVKDHNGRSGRGRKVCRFFKELDEILGTRAATRPPQILESSATVDPPAEEEVSSSDEQLDNEVSLATDVGGDGADSEIEETPVLTPASTLASNSSEDGRDGSSIRNRSDLEDKLEPLTKKSKTTRAKKASTVEKALGGMMEKFYEYQERADERFTKYEEQRRKEEREHEERMLRMMMTALHPQSAPPVPPPQLYYGHMQSTSPPLPE